MKFTKSIYFAPACLSLLVCALLCASGLIMRPLFPVDETRYVTVAWEMHQSGNWVLPTLNHEAYHHKPPVLFWLINIMWALFGVSQQAAMVVPYLASFSVLMLTARLSTRLYPNATNAPLFSVALLAGSLPFVIYSNLIMFDMLLSVFVLIGITAIWDFFKTGKNIHLLTLAAAIGLGAITKGPVILLHLAPALIMIKFWTDKDSRPPLKSWLPKILLSLLGGVAIGLCWAIPAALEGGKEFAEKIFYGQTAGRMVNAFDHKQPIYWYLFFIPLFLMPWLFSPTLCRTTKTVLAQKSIPVKFLLIWIIPVFIAFCLISGKQVHYLLPLISPLALLLTATMLQMPETLRKRDVFGLGFGTTILMMMPHLVHLVSEPYEHIKNSAAYLDEVLDGTSLVYLPATAILMIMALVFCKKNTRRTILCITAFMALMISSFQISVKESFFVHYNLSPIATAIAPLENRPMAFAGNYAGEFGFMARRNHPITEIYREDIAKWFTENPTGVVIVFDKVRNHYKYEQYHWLFQMPFRMTSTYMVLELKK